MKILRIYIKVPPCAGGMEQHIKNLTLKQLNQGHYVMLAFNEGDKITASDMKIAGFIKLQKIKPQFLSFFLFHFFLVIELFLNRRKVDLIHIHGDWSSLLFVKPIKYLTRACKVVYSNHGHINVNNMSFRLLIFLLKQTDMIHCTGIETADILERHTSKKVFFQPSGIRDNFQYQDINKRLQKRRNNIILTVANLVPVKNILFIFHLASKLQDMSFYIVGAGALRMFFEEEINRRDLRNVFLMGAKDDYELAKLYERADLFLLTSYKEGFPTVVMEAMYFGLPIVSSNAGQISNLLKNDVNGFIIDDFIEENYINAINNIYFNNMLYDSIAQNNINLAGEFTWEKCANNISRNMMEILEDKK